MVTNTAFGGVRRAGSSGGHVIGKILQETNPGLRANSGLLIIIPNLPALPTCWGDFYWEVNIFLIIGSPSLACYANPFPYPIL